VHFIFSSAEAASGDRRIAARIADMPAIYETSGKPRENIARQKREKGTTAWRKTVVATG